MKTDDSGDETVWLRVLKSFMLLLVGAVDAAVRGGDDTGEKSCWRTIGG